MPGNSNPLLVLSNQDYHQFESRNFRRIILLQAHARPGHFSKLLNETAGVGMRAPLAPVEQDTRVGIFGHAQALSLSFCFP